MNHSSLKYKDEADRSLGLAGTAIAIHVWKGQDNLIAMDLDTEPGQGLSMSPEFGFGGNPRLSARLAWQIMLKNLELTTAMVAGNVMCRSYVGNARPLSSQARATLRALVHDEGQRACQLDDDECDRLLARILDIQQQLFSHSGVAAIARRLAADFVADRRLSAAEIADRLAALGSL